MMRRLVLLIALALSGLLAAASSATGPNELHLQITADGTALAQKVALRKSDLPSGFTQMQAQQTEVLRCPGFPRTREIKEVQVTKACLAASVMLMLTATARVAAAPLPVVQEGQVVHLAG